VGQIVTQKEALRLRDEARTAGKKAVFTNGCFDILHRGHVEYLQSASILGDLLFVGVNSDASVARIKGPERPIVVLEDRMRVLASLACVDYVVSFDEDTPAALIDRLVPDVLVKGGDWEAERVVGRATVEGHGGRVAIVDFRRGYSTRKIIERIKERYCKKGQ
jgi:rfaE bifunctional protein nucleotidyltransferase chain/domain